MYRSLSLSSFFSDCVYVYRVFSFCSDSWGLLRLVLQKQISLNCPASGGMLMMHREKKEIEQLVWYV
jgi:hypothetical protein